VKREIGQGMGGKTGRSRNEKISMEERIGKFPALSARVKGARTTY
jgi:hypothetical protein